MNNDRWVSKLAWDTNYVFSYDFRPYFDYLLYLLFNCDFCINSSHSEPRVPIGTRRLCKGQPLEAEAGVAAMANMPPRGATKGLGLIANLSLPQTKIRNSQ